MAFISIDSIGSVFFDDILLTIFILEFFLISFNILAPFLFNPRTLIYCGFDLLSKISSLLKDKKHWQNPCLIFHHRTLL